MVGHVNMMDDVLISNLPPELLRSSLRCLLARGHGNQAEFTKHVRERLLASEGDFPEPEKLFSEPDIVTDSCAAYIARTRCTFSSHLAIPALSRLSYFCQAIVQSNASWKEGSDLSTILEDFGGDLVQAVQALKEVPDISEVEFKTALKELLSSLERCQTYCSHHEPSALDYPFARGERQIQDIYEARFPLETSEGPASTSLPSLKVASVRSTKVDTFELGGVEFPMLFNGLWQLSSAAWGSATAVRQQQALERLAISGMFATDMADHYGDAELIYGDFRNSLKPELQSQVFAATKWCVFKPVHDPITPDWVMSMVEARARRLQGRVDILQFHWYDYRVEGWLRILEHLVALSKSRPDLIGAVGLCNFDSQRTQEACEYLLAKTGSVGIVSNQVQFSVIDSRPLQEMCTVCDTYGLKLLTYGSFAGGLISAKWLDQEVPEMYSESSKLTPSQRKYCDMIRNWGSWSEFQQLLKIMEEIGKKHTVSLTNIATRWVLQQTAVGAVIVGTRLGVSEHADDNLKIFDFELDDVDLRRLEVVALGDGRQKTRMLFEVLGDCGQEYRSV